MLKLLIVLALIGGGAFAAVHFHVVKAPNLSLSSVTSKFAPKQPAIKSLAEIANSTASATPAAGKVAGISTQKIGAVGQTISDKGSGIASALSSLITTDANDPKVTIDVQKISDQIGAQMEKLPAAVVNQAKVAYCTQVLIDATKSAEKKQ